MNGYNFTERARHALAAARQESGRFGHEYVGTEHVLIGLLRDDGSLGYRIVANVVEPEELIGRIEGIVKRGKGEYFGPDLPYTSRAKKVIELAMDQAVELHHGWVGTEHILLGLVAEGKGIAAQTLVDAGITLDRARAEFQRLLAEKETAEKRATRHVSGSEAFAALDMRVGRVLKVELSAAQKPTWRLTIDFGPEIGTRVSIAGLRNYEADALVGKLVVCAMNLGTKKMGPEVSEVLVLGVPAPNGAQGTIILTTEAEAELGAKVY